MVIKIYPIFEIFYKFKNVEYKILATALNIDQLIDMIQNELIINGEIFKIKKYLYPTEGECSLLCEYEVTDKRSKNIIIINEIGENNVRV